MELLASRAVVDAIRALSAEAQPMEVGGVLLGLANAPEMRVTTLIGPGPNARSTPVSFEPDYAFQQAQLNQLYEDAGGNLDYLGDWHSHPGGSPTPSLTDRRALRAIRAATDARCPNPVMVIVGDSRSWIVRAFQLAGRGTREIAIRTVN